MNQRKTGTILSYVAMGLNVLRSFIYVPLLLAFLTKQQYGLYQLVGSMIAYLGIMDFGLDTTTVRYYSRLLATKDTKAQENLLAIIGRLYSGIAVLVVAVGVLLLHYLFPLYNNTLSPEDLITAKIVYWIMLFNLAISIPGHIFSAVIKSHEKFIFLKSINILNIVLQPILIYIILNFKANIIVLVLVQTCFNLGVFFANAWFSVVKLKVKFTLHYWDKHFVKEILCFSFFVFINAFLSPSYWKTGQLILGAVSGTVAVAIYSIAVQLITSFWGFADNICGVFLPHFSSLAIREDSMTEINAIFLKLSRLQCYIALLLIWGFILFGRQFIILWAGKDFLPAYTYVLIFLVGQTIPLVQSSGILILQAKNKHAFRAIVYFIIALLNILISIPVAKRYGAAGCAWVTTVCLLVGQVLIINIYYKKIGLYIGSFFKQISWIFVITFPVGFFAWWVLNQFSLLVSPWILAGEIVLFTIVYSVSVYFFAFNSYEKTLILSYTDVFLKNKLR